MNFIRRVGKLLFFLGESFEWISYKRRYRLCKEHR
ncbi:unnamed protein product [Brugia pahangi]|uniref:Transporter n=1 Tax=Brugia pahangi TaxID=6280 RepID=A0A0N4TAW6_BRUPA|nr:unnamed protein product [Brugia pahangi]